MPADQQTERLVAARQRRKQSLAALRQLLTGTTEALLTACDAQGILRTSLVEVTPHESDGIVYFESDLATRDQVRHCPDVLLTCADRSTGRWLVLNGIASIRASSWRRDLPSWLTPDRADHRAEIEVQVLSADLWE